MLSFSVRHRALRRQRAAPHGACERGHRAYDPRGVHFLGKCHSRRPLRNRSQHRQAIRQQSKQLRRPLLRFTQCFPRSRAFGTAEHANQVLLKLIDPLISCRIFVCIEGCRDRFPEDGAGIQWIHWLRRCSGLHSETDARPYLIPATKTRNPQVRPEDRFAHPARSRLAVGLTLTWDGPAVVLRSRRETPPVFPWDRSCVISNMEQDWARYLMLERPGNSSDGGVWTSLRITLEIKPGSLEYYSTDSLLDHMTNHSAPWSLKGL